MWIIMPGIYYMAFFLKIVPIYNVENIKKYIENVIRKKVKVKLLSRVWLSATPWTVAYRAPLSMKFSRQGYGSGLLFSFPWELPDPGSIPGRCLPIWATRDANNPKITYINPSCGCFVAKSFPTLCDSWTVACQAPLSMGLSSQGYWHGLPCPSPGKLGVPHSRQLL